MVQAERPALSVVVPTRDRPALLSDCLKSLVDSLGSDDELIVVDSASVGTETGERAAANGARVIRCDTRGASLARNRGWQAARHEFVAFIDDDVRVAPGWADAIARTLARPGVAFVSGRLGVPQGQEDRERAVAILDEEAASVLDGSDGGLAGHSANLAVRRDALAAVGGFDEALGPGRPFIAEDADLFDRLFSAGFSGRYEPAACGWHEQWRERPDHLKLEWRYGLGAGARLAKLLRMDRRRWRPVARDILGAWCLRTLRDDLRKRYRFGVLADLVRVTGVAAGFVRVIPVPIRDGHLQRRRRDR